MGLEGWTLSSAEGLTVMRCGSSCRDLLAFLVPLVLMCLQGSSVHAATITLEGPEILQLEAGSPFVIGLFCSNSTCLGFFCACTDPANTTLSIRGLPQDCSPVSGHCNTTADTAECANQFPCRTHMLVLEGRQFLAPGNYTLSYFSDVGEAFANCTTEQGHTLYSCVRQLQVRDTQPPVLLVTPTTLVLHRGETFNPMTLGVSAYDTVGGNLTDRLQWSNTSTFVVQNSTLLPIIIMAEVRVADDSGNTASTLIIFEVRVLNDNSDTALLLVTFPLNTSVLSTSIPTNVPTGEVVSSPTSLPASGGTALSSSLVVPVVVSVLLAVALLLFALDLVWRRYQREQRGAHIHEIQQTAMVQVNHIYAQRERTRSLLSSQEERLDGTEGNLPTRGQVAWQADLCHPVVTCSTQDSRSAGVLVPSENSAKCINLKAYAATSDSTPWLHGLLARYETEKALLEYGRERTGYFLVRRGKDADSYALSVVVDGRVQHHLITLLSGEYAIDGRPYPGVHTLAALVEYLAQPCTEFTVVLEAFLPCGHFPALVQAPTVRRGKPESKSMRNPNTVRHFDAAAMQRQSSARVTAADKISPLVRATRSEKLMSSLPYESVDEALRPRKCSTPYGDEESGGLYMEIGHDQHQETDMDMEDPNDPYQRIGPAFQTSGLVAPGSTFTVNSDYEDPNKLVVGPFPPSNLTSNDEPLHKIDFEADGSTTYAQASWKPDLYEIPRANVTLIRELGRGQYGAVFQALVLDILEPNVKSTAAVKTLHTEDTGESDKVEFLKETTLMLPLHHPNVLRMHGMVTRDSPMMIVLEYMNQGSLESYLSTHALGAELGTDIVAQVAQGMRYLADANIIHRDLAARNCLVDENEAGTIHIKVSDFGLSRILVRFSSCAAAPQYSLASCYLFSILLSLSLSLTFSLLLSLTFYLLLSPLSLF